MDKILELIFKIWKSLFRFFRFKTKEFLLFVILCMSIYYMVVIGFNCSFNEGKLNFKIEKKSLEQKGK